MEGIYRNPNWTLKNAIFDTFPENQFFCTRYIRKDGNDFPYSQWSILSSPESWHKFSQTDNWNAHLLSIECTVCSKLHDMFWSSGRHNHGDADCQLALVPSISVSSTFVHDVIARMGSRCVIEQDIHESSWCVNSCSWPWQTTRAEAFAQFSRDIRTN